MSRRVSKKRLSARGKRRYKGSALEAYNLARKAGKKYKRGKRGGKRRAKASGKKRAGKYARRRRSGAPRAKKYSASGIQHRRKQNLMVQKLVAKGYDAADARYLANRVLSVAEARKRREAREAIAKSAAERTRSAEARKAALEALIDDFLRRHPQKTSAGVPSASANETITDVRRMLAETSSLG